MNNSFENIRSRFLSGSFSVGIIGMGYVGLPLALEFAKKGIKTLGFDIDESKIPMLNEGRTYIKHILGDRIQEAVDSKQFSATSDFSRLTFCSAVLICVPTPLDDHNNPDLSYVENSTRMVKKYLQPGQLVVLESTTWPGTTEEVLKPILEGNKVNSQSSIVNRETNENQLTIDNSPLTIHDSPLTIHDSLLTCGVDFYLAFSPEREDPNNPDFTTATIPKVLGGVTEKCTELTKILYDHIIVQTVPVSSTRVAEASKLLENIYRSVNIALVNELKMIFDKMDIDIWEVIEAAKTKPFGFTPFYPGPGLGGHCIPIDPFYLSWKAKEFDIHTKFIELAGEINTNQPYYVVQKTMEALNEHGKALKGSKVLILGASYKKNIDDMRESPTLKLIEIFREKGATVEYNDPYVPKLPPTRKYKFDLTSVELNEQNLTSFDIVVISTAHDTYDYAMIFKNAALIVDARNALESKGIKNGKIFKA